MNGFKNAFRWTTHYRITGKFLGRTLKYDQMIDKLTEQLKAKIENSPDRCFFNEGAYYSDITDLQDQYNFFFPYSIAYFLSCYEGGFISLFDPAKKIDIESLAWNSNTFLSLPEIEEALDRISYKFDGSDKIFIPILRTSVGEHLAFSYPHEGDESKIYDIWHEASVREWESQVVYNDFKELLKAYIENNGVIETIG